MDNKTLLEMLYKDEARMLIDIGDDSDKRLYTGVSVDFTYKGWTRSDGPDCSINHWGYNFYIRTRAGVLWKKYKTLERAIQEIKKVIEKNGKKVTKIVIDNGEYSREESNVEYYKWTA